MLRVAKVRVAKVRAAKVRVAKVRAAKVRVAKVSSLGHAVHMPRDDAAQEVDLEALTGISTPCLLSPCDVGVVGLEACCLPKADEFVVCS